MKTGQNFNVNKIKIPKFVDMVFDVPFKVSEQVWKKPEN